MGSSLPNERCASLPRAPRPHRPPSFLSKTLLNVIYVDNNTQHLQDSSSVIDKGEGAGHLDAKSGVRVMQVSPDGEHLASGDRAGNLRQVSPCAAVAARPRRAGSAAPHRLL